MSTRTASATRTSGPRVRVSVPLALALLVAYAAVFIVVAASSRIPYGEWFASGANAFRAAVLPLAAGTVLLVAFLAWARWDHVFRDPERLPVHGAYRVAVGVFALGFVAHLVFVRWDRLTPGLLAAVLAAGVLVGFCEETVFRGILLRSLRDGTRSEAACLVWTSAVFGLFHLTNLVVGSPPSSVLTQVGLAATSGAILWVFRRLRGLLVVGMVAHGLWDISLFLPGGAGGTAGALVGLVLLVLVPLTGVLVAVVAVLRERRTVAGARPAPRRSAPDA